MTTWCRFQLGERTSYGLVEDDTGGPDLAYAMDMEAGGKGPAPHLSARLRRVG